MKVRVTKDGRRWFTREHKEQIVKERVYFYNLPLCNIFKMSTIIDEEIEIV